MVDSHFLHVSAFSRNLLRRGHGSQLDLRNFHLFSLAISMVLPLISEGAQELLQKRSWSHLAPDLHRHSQGKLLAPHNLNLDKASAASQTHR
jgi:hypothetical protein